MKTVSRIDPIPRQKKKLRVAAYCRVSTDMEAQLESLEAQKNYYENYIGSRADWVLVGIYYDEGITGTKKDKRPDLLRMMEDCEAGKIDFILTKSVSRLSRNTADCLELVRRLMELHIPIYFEKENLNTSDTMMLPRRFSICVNCNSRPIPMKPPRQSRWNVSRNCRTSLDSRGVN